MDLPVSLGLLATVLGASLAGSVHCGAMCGPFVLVYSAASSPDGASGVVGASCARSPLQRSVRRWLPHLAYHGGRALTYVTLGAVAGALGSTVDWAFEAAGLVRFAAFVSGALVVLWGVSALLPALRLGGGMVGPLRRGLVQLGTKPRVVRASLLGVLTPLLPCGWLYAFVLTAGGTGSALGGALVMLAFVAGTVPALLGVGFASGKLAQLLRPRMPVVTAALLVLVGLSAVVSRALMPLPASAREERPSAEAASSEIPGAGHHCH